VESYRLGRQIRIFLPFFYVFATVIVVTSFISMSSDGDSGGLIFLMVWSVGVATQALVDAPENAVED